MMMSTSISDSNSNSNIHSNTHSKSKNGKQLPLQRPEQVQGSGPGLGPVTGTLPVQLESRSQVMARISAPPRFTGIHTKDSDRGDHIALLLIQMMKDIKTVQIASIEAIDRLRNLRGMASIVGSKKWLKDLEECTSEAMELLEFGCEEILDLTQKKHYMMDAERRLTALENKEQARSAKRAVGLAHIRKVAPAAVKTKCTKQENVRKIIARRGYNTDSSCSSIAINANKKQQHGTRSNQLDETLDYRAAIILRDGKTVLIPPPEYDPAKIIYTMRELIMHLAPHDGMGVKRIAGTLSKEGRCYCAERTFMRRFAQYKKDKILPEVSDFGDSMGRPTPIPLESMCKVVDINQHSSNLSELVRNRMIKESRRLPVSGRKRKAPAKAEDKRSKKDSSKAASTLVSNQSDTSNEADKTITYGDGATITLYDGTKVRIPSPEYDPAKVHYTLHELVVHLAPYDGKGLKRIVAKISKDGQCRCSMKTFMRWLGKLKKEKILPEISSFGDSMGRPPSKTTTTTPIATSTPIVTTTTNTSEHQDSNLSYVKNAIDIDELPRKCLESGSTKKAQAEKKVAHSSSGAGPTRCTVKSYDRFQALMGPGI